MCAKPSQQPALERFEQLECGDPICFKHIPNTYDNSIIDCYYPIGRVAKITRNSFLIFLVLLFRIFNPTISLL